MSSFRLGTKLDTPGWNGQNGPAAARPTVGLNRKKKSQKWDSKIREINWFYLPLQQFYKYWISSACNDRKRKSNESVETWLEKIREIWSSVLIFGGFEVFETTVRTTLLSNYYCNTANNRQIPTRSCPRLYIAKLQSGLFWWKKRE